MISTKGKTLVEVLNEIAEALIKQGKQATNCFETCVYEDTEGNHCAIGFLLEEHGDCMGLAGGLESTSFQEALRREPQREFIELHQRALSILQELHDACSMMAREDVLLRLEELVGEDLPAFQPWVMLGTM